MTFPYPTISSWFEENGDFPENLEDERSLVEVLGDETDAIVEPEWPTSVDVTPCVDHGEHLKSQRHTEEECPLFYYEPCCYNSTRNFGTGDHEWGCPNY